MCGRTPHYDLIIFNADVIAEDFCALLSEDNLVCGPVFRIVVVEDSRYQGTLQLIVSSVLVAAAGWDLRVVRVVNKLNFQILKMLEEPSSDDCPNINVVLRLGL